MKRLRCRIHLFQNPTQLPPNENLIVQEYLDQPYVLDGYKIDLRIYVLVTHCDPLKAFIYRDGLVRLGTEKYTSPSHDNMVRALGIFLEDGCIREFGMSSTITGSWLFRTKDRNTLLLSI